MVNKEWYRAKLRSILAERLNEAPQQPCHYCQAIPGDWCEYDCGSPFPVLHPENRETDRG